MNKLQEIIAVGLISLPLALGIPGCEKIKNEYNTKIPKTEKIQQENKLRNTILGYLSQPRFSNSDFMEQITGTKAELRMLDLTDGMIYLSIPKIDYTKEIFEKLTLNPSLIEFGKTAGGEFSGERITLGDYVLRSPEDYFFRFPSNHFKVNELDTIRILYESSNYSVSMDELQDFMSNKSIYGGYLSIDTGVDRQGMHHTISNHGAFVAKKGEESLERLVNSIIGSERTKEGKSQRLLDFTTKELEYDHSETNLGVEVLKRPNEVLMSGGSDCSGKVILYASLLEQIDMDYRLVYFDNHIAVAVSGEYAKRNGLNFSMNDTPFSIAETTAKGFQIGNSRLNVDIGIDEIRYIQKPGENSKIYDAKTGKALPFF
tara:strand:+ start:1105 stop:2223 length:1119 start_codon:yes stop_codon:yes gene_type:complete